GYHDPNCRKRQYLYEPPVVLRDPKLFASKSKEAEVTRKNIHGHLGRSILELILDVPLPHSILIDYQHVTLLRHFRDVVKQISTDFLTPAIRKQLDYQLRTQPFPHFFNRRMRGIEDFSYIKATKLRNLLLYGFLPNFYSVLQVDQAAHIVLFICGIRSIHNLAIFGDRTSAVADVLLTTYYRDHSKFLNHLENFVLHLHAHYADKI
ncbi:unnamed protein product, partial [Didymodactylos carnosus]